jgi:hypothetical protein
MPIGDGEFRQRVAVLFRHPAEPVKLADPGLHTDYDLEPPGGGDQIARTGGSAERHFDIEQVGHLVDPAVIAAVSRERSMRNRSSR